ncbi:MAG: NeuD/PglB/VioB family sugar acetyltransferase [Cyclobacteriaceae bacterium]|nr:NeuD/PglB/VioB family sugar acetyltransferase [Cyclobacteriaceae bacterium]
MNLKNIAIIGAGGLGKELAVLIHQINEQEPQWNFIGFYDDTVKESVLNFPVLGTISSLKRNTTDLHLVLGVGNPQVKRKIINALSEEFKFPTLIHPSASIGLEVNIASGSIISAGCRLTASIQVGSFVLLNLNATVGHDVVIGDYCSIMPGAHISGNVSLQSEVMIGTGASVLQGIQVGAGAQIGAGAVVINQVETMSTVVGIPAQPLKR